jgi:hypothetical protein
MSEKPRVLHIKPAHLWPSVLRVGGVTVQFQTGKRGRRVKVSSPRHQPRHKRLQKGG